jgi:hypothetical protein
MKLASSDMDVGRGWGPLRRTRYAYVKNTNSWPSRYLSNLLAHVHQFGDNGVDEGDILVGVSESGSAPTLGSAWAVVKEPASRSGMMRS